MARDPYKLSSKYILGFIIILASLLDESDGSLLAHNVSKCPMDKAAWETRAKAYGCVASERPKYHCARDLKGNLIEACIIPLDISPGREGCPSVRVHTDGNAYHRDRLIECPMNNTHCPPKNHTGYKTNELYKFTACILPSMEKTEDAVKGNDKGIKECNCRGWQIGFTIAVFAALIPTVVLIIKYCRGKRCGKNSADTNRKNNQEKDDGVAGTLLDLPKEVKNKSDKLPNGDVGKGLHSDQNGK